MPGITGAELTTLKGLDWLVSDSIRINHPSTKIYLQISPETDSSKCLISGHDDTEIHEAEIVRDDETQPSN